MTVAVLLEEPRSGCIVEGNATKQGQVLFGAMEITLRKKTHKTLEGDDVDVLKYTPVNVKGNGKNKRRKR